MNDTDRKYFTPVDVDWTAKTAEEIATFLFANKGKFDELSCMPFACRILGLISDSMKRNSIHLERD